MAEICHHNIIIQSRVIYCMLFFFKANGSLTVRNPEMNNACQMARHGCIKCMKVEIAHNLVSCQYDKTI